MANYGIVGAGALSASNDSDIIVRSNPSTGQISAATVAGLDGNDLIALGTIGSTGMAIASITLNAATNYSGTTGAVLTGELFGSAGTSLAVDTQILSGGLGTYAATATALVTSQQAARILWGSQIYGNAGNDTIAFGTQINNLTSSTIGGGAGNDVIGTYQYFQVSSTPVAAVNTAGTWEKAFVEGGGGNDTILIDASENALVFSSVTIQGSQGVDTATIRTNGAISKSLFALGGDDDGINLTASAAITSTTVAGGGGNDAVNIFWGNANSQNNLVLGDALNSIGTYDGNDTIVITADADALVSAFTVQGGGGADSISLGASDVNWGVAGAVIQGQIGNDTIRLATGIYSAASVQGGAGDDYVAVMSASTASLYELGGGNDTILLGNNALAAGYTGSTIYGDAGADLFTASAGGDAALNMRFAYVSAGDSTLSAMDTIAIGGGNGSQLQFRFDANALVRANFITANVGGTAIASATNGVVGWGADAPSDLTSRVAFLNNQISTEGHFAIFSNNNNNRSYLFIQGGSGSADDLVAQIGSAGSVSGATVTMGATNNAFSATFV